MSLADFKAARKFVKTSILPYCRPKEGVVSKNSLFVSLRKNGIFHVINTALNFTKLTTLTTQILEYIFKLSTLYIGQMCIRDRFQGDGFGKMKCHQISTVYASVLLPGQNLGTNLTISPAAQQELNQSTASESALQTDNVLLLVQVSIIIIWCPQK